MNTMKKLTFMKLATLAVSAWTASGAHAGTDGEFNVSGFGTLGAAATDTDDAKYRYSDRQSNGVGTSPDLGVLSRIGIQGQLQLTPRFSAVGQVLVSRRDGKQGPQVEWLLGQLKATDWADIRVGRMVLPVFMVSDTRNVGYASHWIHSPHEVYNHYPPSSFDGSQLVLHQRWMDINFTVQPSIGRTEAKITNLGLTNAHMKFGRLEALNVSAEFGDWTARWAQLLGRDGSLKTSTFVFPKQALDKFTAFGLQYDSGSLLLMSEVTRRRASGGLTNSNAFYVSSGYRLGDWMPFATYSRMKPIGPTWGTAGPDSTRSFGVRWDAARSVAIKAQLDVSNAGRQYVDVAPAFAASGDRVKVFALAADFVF
jgi:hypothetical protein